jgi:hypothetical protein
MTERLLYHTGMLARDRDPDFAAGPASADAAKELDHLATWWMQHAEKGKAVLFQKRIGPECFEYYGVML